MVYLVELVSVEVLSQCQNYKERGEWCGDEAWSVTSDKMFKWELA